MNEVGLIYKKINDVMKDVGAVEKEKKSQQGYQYRGVDQVMNALQPCFVKHGVFVVPEVISEKREERQTAKGGNLTYTVLKMNYRFYAEDGSHIAATVIGEGMDSGDKSANKAMSIAYKYACFQVLSIPTEEIVDPDDENHDVKPKNEKSKPKKPPKEEIPPPAPPEPEFVTDKDKTFIISAFKQSIGKPSENPEIYTEILKQFGATKFEEIKRIDLHPMIEYIKAYKPASA